MFVFRMELLYPGIAGLGKGRGCLTHKWGRTIEAFLLKASESVEVQIWLTLQVQPSGASPGEKDSKAASSCSATWVAEFRICAPVTGLLPMRIWPNS